MRLLSKKSAEVEIKKSNEELIETNIRLRKFEKDIRERLNTIREDYEPDKVRKLKEFEAFCLDIQNKKSKLLEELSSLQKAIDDKKELYYGLIAKNDALAEKEHKISESAKKLDLRLLFVEDLEKKWQERDLQT